MGLSLQYLDSKLVGISRNELGNQTRSDLTPLLVLGDELEILLKPILDGMRLKRPATIRGQVGKLKSLGEALTYLNVTRLPQTESGWQGLILNIHRFILTRTDRKSSLQTRCSSEWLTVRGFLVELIEASVIPTSVFLPPVREVLNLIDISSYQDRLLGQSSAEVVSAKESISKLMCTISLFRTDAEYLEEIRDTLSHRRQLLFEALLDYWTQLKNNMEFGKKLIASVDWEQLRPQVEGWAKRDPSNHPANPSKNVEGLANYLAVILHEYNGCPPSDDDLRNMAKTNECLPRLIPFGKIAKWESLIGAPRSPFHCTEWSDKRVLWWWQGRTSHFDVTVITALLIMLHPSWTPASLMLAKVTNRNGRQYLDMSDIGYSFEVDKPRASAMKQESLDPLAYEIISTLINESAALRNELQNLGDSKATLLFLPYGKGHSESKIVAPIPSMASAFLSGRGATPNSLWIGLIYPQLVSCGLTAGTISFKKIRNTEGVLEWFRTKSLRAVARKLGNTERVVLQHYIPRALLEAWNTRMIRRFQNLWLSVAAANEEFMLDVTDFANVADLHAFLRDMLQLHGSTESPLAELMHQRFNPSSGMKGNTRANDEADLHVAISKGALSALYSYQATVLGLGLPQDVLDRQDILTGLSPRHFLSLADLLQSRLPVDKNPDYVACHDAAINFSSNPENRLKWAELLT